MGVLLKGLKMPKGNSITVNIYRDCSWVDVYTTENGDAIEINPHGRVCILDDVVVLNEGESMAVEAKSKMDQWKPCVDFESEWVNDPIYLGAGDKFNRWRCKKCGYIRTGGFNNPNSMSVEDKKPLDRFCGWCGAHMIKGSNSYD